MPGAVVDGDRLLARLRVLADSAPSGNGGVTRLAWSEEDIRARALLAGWAVDAGLVVRTDAVGNLIAELAGRRPGLAPLASGSHLDTVVDGGPLDGAYGVVAAFEVAGALANAGERLDHPLRAVAWVNEEGVVAPPFTGSSVAAGGALDLEALGPDGLSLAERIVTTGGDPAGLPGAAWPALAGYLELHIEQGPVLEASGVGIGKVTGITGMRRGWVTLQGAADHAGTTPMTLRRDALVAAAHVVLAIRALATEGAAEVATAGIVEVKPGNMNVVPGSARISFDVRGVDDAALGGSVDRLRQEVREIAVEHGVTAAISLSSSSAAVQTDAALSAAIHDAASARGHLVAELPSGAGHDAQHVAALGPVGMIFVPSIGGVSHSPSEATAPDDLVAGAVVLLDALRLADERLP